MTATIPSDTQAVGNTGHTTDHNNIADVLALLAGGTAGSTLTTAQQAAISSTVFLGASGGDDVANFNAALAALPTVTLSNGATPTPATLVVPCGTIVLTPGAYTFGSLGTNTNNIGPCVNVLGLGRNAVTVDYYGSMDGLRMYNSLVGADRAFDDLPARHGRIDGFIIDGTNATAGASGLHYGDTEGGVLGPDLEIRNFSQGTIAAPTGLGATAVGSGGTFAAGTYWWVVTALTRTGETVVSASATATLVLHGSANLSWTAPSGTLTGYRVYRNTSNSFTNSSYTLVADQVSGTSYTDTGASLSTTTAPPVNISGNNGLWLDNAHAWTESLYGRVILRNNANNVMCSVQADSGVDIGPSFEYNDLTFKVYAWPNQNGIVFREGAWAQHGSWKMRANFANSSAAQSCAALVVCGVVPAGNIKAGNYSQMINGRLDIQAESNSLASGSGTNYPQTIAFGDVNQNVMMGLTGILSFYPLTGGWVPSNWNNSNKYSLQFLGVISGDANLNPANDNHIVHTGGLTRPQGKFPSGTTFRASSGDFFNVTLGSNVTVAFDPFYLVAGPAEKVIVMSQPATGGTYTYTITWPKPGSPTLSSPAIYWPGGTAPTMSTGAGATDVYVLRTTDGIHWYGQALQAMS